MARWQFLTVVVVAILAIVIALQNTQAVSTKLLFITVTMPRAVLLFVVLLIGFLMGLLTAQRLARRASRKADATGER